MKNLFTIMLFALLANILTAQVTKTIDVTTPGTLTTLLTADEKTTVTDLTLTGNIDVRDVKCMRDEMTILANIDMSAVNIMEYFGSDGTFSYTTYPANEIPVHSFSTFGKTIGKTSLKSIQLPTTLTSIRTNSFYKCKGLTSIVIPNMVTSIESQAFYNCSGLTEVTLGSSVSTIEDAVFYQCSSLNTITSLNPTPPTLGTNTFDFDSSSNSRVVILVSASSVNAYKAATGWNAFNIGSTEKITIHVPTSGGLAAALIAAGHIPLSGIASLTITGNLNSTDIIQLKNSLTSLIDLDLSGAMLAGNSLPASAFQEKKLLRLVKLPFSLETIGDYAFYGCSNLTSVLPLPAGLISIGHFAFSECRSLSGDLIIPNSVTVIGDKAFRSCSGFNGELRLPNSLKSIGDGAFYICSGLTGKLTLPNTLTTIPDQAFYDCSGLTGEVIFPQSITQIGYYAFEACSKLTELTFGKNVVNISNGAFQGCSSIVKITMPRTTPPLITSSTFTGVNIETCTVHVPIGTAATYQSDPIWGLFILFNETGAAETYSITVYLGANGTIKENNVALSNGSVLTVTPGSTKIFTLVPDAGFEVATMTYNGVDVRSQMNNNVFTTPAINANATLSVTFQKVQYRLSLKNASSGTINLLCEYGATPSFDFTVEPNWSVNTILYNNVDVTTNLLNGVFTVPAITANGLLSVSFINASSGAPELINSRIKVYSTNSEIIVEGTTNDETVSLYTLNGTHLQTLKSQGERISIPASRDAVYIVKTESKTFKVMM
ncbi:MAG TPA: leucine-rich repeat domain-containing protein [Paludibacteraceae bacterium]|nr:leucine-rich repeat domain-containing protein [Paludibacteraceae bacterium]